MKRVSSVLRTTWIHWGERWTKLFGKGIHRVVHKRTQASNPGSGAESRRTALDTLESYACWLLSYTLLLRVWGWASDHPYLERRLASQAPEDSPIQNLNGHSESLGYHSGLMGLAHKARMPLPILTAQLLCVSGVGGHQGKLALCLGLKLYFKCILFNTRKWT